MYIAIIFIYQTSIRFFPTLIQINFFTYTNSCIPKKFITVKIFSSSFPLNGRVSFLLR